MATRYRHYRHHRHHHYTPSHPLMPKRTITDALKRALPKILIKGVVMTVVLFILTLPSINFFSAITNTGLGSAFSSVLFLVSFITLLVLFAIYDFATSHRVWFVEDIFASVLVLVFLASTAFVLLTVLLSFVLMVVGNMAGSVVRQLSLSQPGMTKMLSGSIGFLLLIWIVYVFLANSNYYAPPTNSSINLNKPYLTQQQLQSVYDSGVYSQSALNAGKLLIGSLDLLFPTTIQTLLFNFSFQNTNAGASYYVTYYNHTYATNFTELVVVTPQASIILATQAPHAQLSGASGNLQYIENLVVSPNSYTALVQQSSFLAILSCEGVLCTQQNFNKTLQEIAIGMR